MPDTGWTRHTCETWNCLVVTHIGVQIDPSPGFTIQDVLWQSRYLLDAGKVSNYIYTRHSEFDTTYKSLNNHNILCIALSEIVKT